MMWQASLEGAPSQGLVHAVAASLRELWQRRAEAASQRRVLMAFVNERRCERTPLFGHDMVEAVRVELPVHHVHVIKQQVNMHCTTHCYSHLLLGSHGHGAVIWPRLLQPQPSADARTTAGLHDRWAWADIGAGFAMAPLCFASGSHKGAK